MNNSNRRVRQQLVDLLRMDADWRAFCQDFFPEVHRQFTSGMCRREQENILLSAIDAATVERALEHDIISQQRGLDLAKDIGGLAAAYFSRGREQLAIQSLLHGRPVFVLAPHRFGKTRFWHAVRRGFPTSPSDRWLILRLSGLGERDLADASEFERSILQLLDEQLGETPELLPRPAPFGALRKRLCDQLRAIERNDGRLLLVMDDFHAVFDAHYSRDFLAFLRARCDDKDAPWDRLRVLFASSLGLLDSPDGRSSSPLANLVQEIELVELTPPEIGELACCYKIPCDTPELAELLKLTGGHPHLVSLAMENAQQRSLAQIVREIALDPGHSVLAPYLKTLWQWLRDQPFLLLALLNVARQPGTPLQAGERRGLWRLGLIRLEYPLGYILRSPVYASLLQGGSG